MLDGLRMFGEGLAGFLNLKILFDVLWSTQLGIIVGMLPGLTATMGVALMTTLVVLSVILIGLLIAGLALYLFIVGSQLTRIAGMLEDCSQIVWKIKADAEVIDKGLGSINNTGRVIAGALPLLYGMAEGIVTGATYEPEPEREPEPAKPASGTRRSRQLEGVGYEPS